MVGREPLPVGESSPQEVKDLAETLQRPRDLDAEPTAAGSLAPFKRQPAEDGPGSLTGPGLAKEGAAKAAPVLQVSHGKERIYVPDDHTVVATTRSVPRLIAAGLEVTSI